MAKRHFLHRKHEPRTGRSVADTATVAGLLELLASEVIDRFVRMGQTNAQAVALAVADPDEDDPAPNPSHPACADVASSDYCHESWQLHLAKLKRRPETHWGVCEHERICAIVPVVCGQRCLAVVKLAAPATLDDAEFKRLLDLLELLVRDFAAVHSDFLSRMPGGATVEKSRTATHRTDDDRQRLPSPSHPQVVRALDYIAAHLSDPGLTVAGVASVLDLYPSYLSEIFVAQVGERMSRFIARQRVELAKRLLATTDWQIKRIALETGHANPNWFCHVFSTHTGQTPGEYRAAAHLQGPAPSDR